MNFSTGHKKTIDRTAPIAAAALAAYYAWRSKKDLKEVAITGGVVLVVAYVIVSQLTRLALNSSERPDRINISPDAAGSIDSAFVPDVITKRLRDDVYSPFGYFSRDKQLYAELAALSNASLLKVYNRWNDLYFNEHGETMPQAMQSEEYGYGWFDDVPQQVRTVIARLIGMGAK